MAKTRNPLSIETAETRFNKTLASNDPQYITEQLIEYTSTSHGRSLCVEQASHIASVLERHEEYKHLVRLVAKHLDEDTIDNRLLYHRMPESLQALVSYPEQWRR